MSPRRSWLVRYPPVLATLAFGVAASRASRQGHAAQGPPNDYALNAVSDVSASDVWVAGFAAQSGQITTLALRWDGRRWSRAPTPSAPGDPAYPADSELYGVSASSSSDAWAVGASFGAATVPLTLHWDGRSWSLVSSPGDVPLAAVSSVSPNDAWAVGTTARYGSVIQQWDGASWKIVKAFGRSSNLSGVSALSASDVWVVGTLGPTGLILHWDGKSWTQVKSPNPTVPSFLGVSARSPKDVWVTGGDVVLHWNGKSWKHIRHAKLVSGGLGAVSAPRSGYAWVVGATAAKRHSPLASLLTIRCNFNLCQRVKNPVSPAEILRLTGVAARTTRDAWAVGDTDVRSGAKIIILHWDGRSWKRAQAGLAGR